MNVQLNNVKTYQPLLQDLIDNSKDLQQLIDEYDDIAQVLSVAAKIQGLPRNISTHAAGIIITKNNFRQSNTALAYYAVILYNYEKYCIILQKGRCFYE